MALIFCACGCGQQREEYNKQGRKAKYIKGHGMKGRKFSPEACEKNRIGHIGLKRSPESIEKTRLANIGRKPSSEHKEKIRIALTGLKRSPEQIEKHRITITGRKQSPEHIEKCRIGNIGKHSKKPEDRIVPLNLQIRGCAKYLEWRIQIFNRDNFTCQKCSVRGGKLHAHHIKSFTKIRKENNIKTLEEAVECTELWYLHNGITYCKTCHDKLKNRGGKL